MLPEHSLWRHHAKNIAYTGRALNYIPNTPATAQKRKQKTLPVFEYFRVPFVHRQNIPVDTYTLQLMSPDRTKCEIKYFRTKSTTIPGRPCVAAVWQYCWALSCGCFRRACPRDEGGLESTLGHSQHRILKYVLPPLWVPTAPLVNSSRILKLSRQLNAPTEP